MKKNNKMLCATLALACLCNLGISFGEDLIPINSIPPRPDLPTVTLSPIQSVALDTVVAEQTGTPVSIVSTSPAQFITATISTQQSIVLPVAAAKILQVPKK